MYVCTCIRERALCVPMKTKCTLIVDTRERNVTRHDIEFANITWEVKQITTADYIVLAPGGNVLAAIERKSLEDFAASLKDGRVSNLTKLIQLRAETGCRIIYLIEGPAYPNPASYYGNIAYKNIESNIFHAIVRDGVSVINTEDSLGTARALARFVTSMDTLVDADEIEGGAPAPLDQVLEKGVAREEMMAMLTRKIEKSDHEIVRELWSCFPGISVTTADDYGCKWSLGEIICGKIPRADIVGHKLASGRAIGKKVVGSLTGIEKRIEVRLLSSIPGVSMGIATELTNMASLATLLGYSVQTIGMIKVGKARRNLGEEKARRILHLFWYKRGGGVPVREDPGHVLGSREHTIHIAVDDKDVQALLDDII